MSSPVVTIFNDRSGYRINAARPMDLEELERVILRAPPVAEKDRLPLLKFAIFGETKNPSGSLRHNKNVVEVTGVEGDYDDEQMPMEDAAEILRKAGIESMLYTSASHTLGRPRWRVLCPLSATLTGDTKQLSERHRHYVGVLNALLGGVLKRESFVLSQCYYFGRINGRPDPTIVRVNGVCVDQIPDAPAPAFPAQPGEGKNDFPHDATTDAELLAAFDNGTDRYQPMLKLSSRWASRGMSEDDIVANLESLLDKAPSGNYHTLRRQVSTIAKSAVKKFSDRARRLEIDQSCIVDEINTAHALILVTGKLYVMWMDRTRWGGVNLPLMSTIEDMRKIWLPRQVGRLNPIDQWIASDKRQFYDGIVFQPGVTNTGEKYNLFSGWGLQPKKGNCSLFLEHLHDVVCDRDDGLYEYLIQWLANIVQTPRNKPGTAIALGGIPGSGKGAIARYLRPFLGAYFAQLASDEQLLGRYNDLLVAKLLIFGDEVAWPGDKRGTEKLKAYITEDRITIEGKYRPMVEVDNFARILTSTNRDHTAPVEINDRRYVPIYVSSRKVGDRAYWSALEAERAGEGPAALLYHLLHEVALTRELRENPKTAALAEQTSLSLDDIGQFWRTMLLEPEHALTEGYREHQKQIAFFEFGEAVPTKVLHDFYLDWAKMNQKRHTVTLDALGRGLRRYIPRVTKRRSSAEETRSFKEPKRTMVYDLPELAIARVQFETAIKGALDWPDKQGNGAIPGPIDAPLDPSGQPDDFQADIQVNAETTGA